MRLQVPFSLFPLHEKNIQGGFLANDFYINYGVYFFCMLFVCVYVLFVC